MVICLIALIALAVASAVAIDSALTGNDDCIEIGVTSIIVLGIIAGLSFGLG